MVVICDIEFDQNPLGIYFAGQTLTGKITLKSDKLKQVKGVVLQVKGYAQTSWWDSGHHHHGNQKSRTRYTAHADYISSDTYLLGSPESQSADIEPGIHTYTFACHLPVTCPSSFEGQYGHIRYLVKVVLIRPWKFDQTYTKGFTVLKWLDLNYDSPLLRVPASTDIIKSFGVFCCKTQPMKVHLNIPQCGYVPGQSIPVNVSFMNDSNKKVKEVKLELLAQICYHSQIPCVRTKTERIVLNKFKFDPVSPKSKQVFYYELPVPATPPTCFNQCQFIQVAYQVALEAKMNGVHATQVLTLPVTIGNVPLLNMSQERPLSCGSLPVTTTCVDRSSVIEYDKMVASAMELTTVASDSISLPTVSGALSRPTSLILGRSLPPPTYEEAVHMLHANISGDDEHDYGETDFAPRYPVFNIPSPSAPLGGDVVDGGFVNGNVLAEEDKGTWL